MKRLLIAAGMAALLLTGALALPASAAPHYRKAEARASHNLAKKRAHWAKKQNKWLRKHPHPTAKQLRHHHKFQEHTLHKQAKLVRKEHNLGAKIAHHRAKKHR